MKNLKVLLFVLGISWGLGFFSTPILSAQTPQDVLKQIETSIKEKNAAQLSKYFNNSLEITLLEYEKVCSKDQAYLVVKDFFSQKPVTQFKLIHIGGSGEAWYGMGIYETSSDSYDANVFIKKYGNVYLIDRLRFEEKN